ncbi:hypothetical protein COW46_00680 [Candidatus Gracilibacteria bacterium CG17_big_fil_post_rev_8_21_14_2_50_48_13]|nr:MAG: hypothetical protein COW46_00680 [Candidatus Gracilibacteria bacterium CG17_big_fil_post_rev_8_21_14_2_50_48_13]
MKNEIVLNQFHLTQNMDDPMADGCRASRFIRCTPQRQLGLIMPSTGPAGWTDGVSPFTTNIASAFLPWTFDAGYYFLLNDTVYEGDQDNQTATLLHTRTPAAGAKDVYNVISFGAYIYYAMEKRLGRLDPATNTFNDNFATFTNGVSSIYHPMRIVNDTLYIGDDDLVAQVDSAGIFTANALDIEPGFSVTALYEWNNQLLIAAAAETNGTSFNERKASYSKIYRWNTWSVSWDTATIVPEELVAGFIVSGGGLYMLTKSDKVRFYRYNEPYADMVMEMPIGDMDTSNNRYATVFPMAFHDYQGTTYFAIGNEAAVTTSYESGIYTFKAKKSGYPPTVQLEYQYRGYETNNWVDYYCLGSLENVGLFWSYHQTENPGEDAAGTDYVSTGNSNSAVSSYIVDTGYITVDRANRKQFRIAVDMGYWTSGTTCAVGALLDGPSGSTQNITMLRDEERRMFVSDLITDECNFIKLQVTISDSSVGQMNDCIQSIRLLFS